MTRWALNPSLNSSRQMTACFRPSHFWGVGIIKVAYACVHGNALTRFGQGRSPSGYSNPRFSIRFMISGGPVSGDGLVQHLDTKSDVNLVVEPPAQDLVTARRFKRRLGCKLICKDSALRLCGYLQRLGILRGPLFGFLTPTQGSRTKERIQSIWKQSVKFSKYCIR